jgi:hypothetical protein
MAKTAKKRERVANTLPGDEPETTMEVARMAPKDAIASFTDEERNVYEDLREQLAGKNDEDLWWHWNFGKRVAEVYRAARKDRKVYKEQFLERLAIALCGRKSDGVLRRAMRIVECWSSKAAFGEIVNMRGPNDNGLTWTHIQHLASVNDADVRAELATKALNETWSSQELYEAVKAATGGKNGTGGRPVKKAQSVEGCLTHMSAQAAKFVNLFDNAWTGEAFDLLAEIGRLAPAKLTDKLLESISDAAANVAELRERVGQMETLLAQVAAAAASRVRTREEALAGGAAETDSIATDDEDWDDPVDDPDDDDAVYDPEEEEYVDDDEDEDLSDEATVNMGAWQREQRQLAASPRKRKRQSVC